MDYIAEIQTAFQVKHGCDATYVETVPVREEWQGDVIWQGEVEVFDLVGHPKATRGYAWGYEDDEQARRYITVLELPPVTSPQTAVQAAIMAEIQNARKKKKGR